MRDVIMPGDSLTVVTPMKTYRLKPKAFEVRSREEISANLKGLLRRDAVIGSSEYRNIIADLENLAQADHLRRCPKTPSPGPNGLRNHRDSSLQGRGSLRRTAEHLCRDARPGWTRSGTWIRPRCSPSPRR